MDGDTFALRKLDPLFDALDRFELAAAFECCRIHWPEKRVSYDDTGFFKGCACRPHCRSSDL